MLFELSDVLLLDPMDPHLRLIESEKYHTIESKIHFKKKLFPPYLQT